LPESRKVFTQKKTLSLGVFNERIFALEKLTQKPLFSQEEICGNCGNSKEEVVDDAIIR
jgi:hypothetical protein